MDDCHRRIPLDIHKYLECSLSFVHLVRSLCRGTRVLSCPRGVSTQSKSESRTNLRSFQVRRLHFLCCLPLQLCLQPHHQVCAILVLTQFQFLGIFHLSCLNDAPNIVPKSHLAPPHSHLSDRRRLSPSILSPKATFLPIRARNFSE